GPNGAGKTTTIRLLTGFLRPSAGTIRLAGFDMSRPDEALRARAELGFVPDVAGLDPATTGARLLDELARLQRRPPLDREVVREALDLAPQDLRRPIGALSRGTRQKINLIQGLQHQPSVLILDEPTEGLDPLGKRALFMLLQAARQRGATIFFSSHVLSEVEELCDRVALIRGGRLIAVDRIAGLRRNMRRQVTLHVEDQSIEALLAALPSVADLRYAEERWHFSVAELQPLLQLLATLPVRDVTIEPPSLADVFLQHYRPEADDA
ncbi:MAG: ABC transporter ATP-binding protein, partial [Chloroflexi bacterium]|nr:ABC transporter ATP-binding protein [Chloroflexota bacterium]